MAESRIQTSIERLDFTEQAHAHALIFAKAILQSDDILVPRKNSRMGYAAPAIEAEGWDDFRTELEKLALKIAAPITERAQYHFDGTRLVAFVVGAARILAEAQQRRDAIYGDATEGELSNSHEDDVDRDDVLANSIFGGLYEGQGPVTLSLEQKRRKASKLLSEVRLLLESSGELGARDKSWIEKKQAALARASGDQQLEQWITHQLKYDLYAHVRDALGDSAANVTVERVSGQLANLFIGSDASQESLNKGVRRVIESTRSKT